MTEKRFEMIITGADGSFHYLDKNTGEKITSTLELENKLNALHEENEQLKAQLRKGEDVCGICKHEYLTPSGDYFIGKCEKGHEECSKEDIKYCEDFELKGEMNEV